jgi:hypothetical protein
LGCQLAPGVLFGKQPGVVVTIFPAGFVKS